MNIAIRAKESKNINGRREAADARPEVTPIAVFNGLAMCIFIHDH